MQPNRKSHRSPPRPAQVWVYFSASSLPPRSHHLIFQAGVYLALPKAIPHYSPSPSPHFFHLALRLGIHRVSDSADV